MASKKKGSKPETKVATTFEKPAEELLKVYLTEFEALYTEVNKQLDLQQSIIGSSLAVVAGLGALLGLSTIEILVVFPEVVVIAALMLSTLTSASIYASTQMVDLGNYMNFNLRPRIEALVPKGFSSQDLSILKWPATYAKIEPRSFLKGILSVGKYAVSFLPSVVFTIIYRGLIFGAGKDPSGLQTFLYWFTIFFISLPFLAGMVNWFVFTNRGKGA